MLHAERPPDFVFQIARGIVAYCSSQQLAYQISFTGVVVEASARLRLTGQRSEILS